MAKAVGDVMVEMLDGTGNIVELTGLIGSSPAIDRQKGMMEALQAAPDITILATGDAEWIRDPAVKLMDDYLVAYPDINAVFSHAENPPGGRSSRLPAPDAAKTTSCSSHTTPRTPSSLCQGWLVRGGWKLQPVYRRCRGSHGSHGTPRHRDPRPPRL